MRSAVVAAACAASALAFDPPSALQLAYHAAAAYCDAGSVNTWSCAPCQLAGDAVNVTAVTDSSLDVHGYVARMSDGSVVVSFRGSDSLTDWIVDNLDFWPTPGPYPGCSSCEVHSGFFNSWLGLSTPVLTALQQFGAFTAPAVHVTGHSLGAAIAQFAAYELLLAGYPVASHIDFGRPRCGNAAFADNYYQVVVAHNFSAAALHADAASLPWSAVLQDAYARASGAADPARVRSNMVAAVKAAAAEAAGDRKHATATTRALRKGAVAAAARAAARAAVASLRGLRVAASPNMPNTTVANRVTHYADPVPHLPFEWMGFTHPPQEVWYSQDQRSYTACSTDNGEDPSCSDSLLIELDVSDHLSYMDIAISSLC